MFYLVECKKCGSYNENSAKFCIGCGAPLGEQTEEIAVTQDDRTREYKKDNFDPEKTIVFSGKVKSENKAEPIKPDPNKKEENNQGKTDSEQVGNDIQREQGGKQQGDGKATQILPSPPPPPPLPPESGKGLAITSMVLGILSLVCPGWIPACLAIIFGKNAQKKGYVGSMANTGVICGTIGLAISLVFSIIAAVTA